MDMKKILADFFNQKKYQYAANEGDEFCPRCDANLTLQRGYQNDLPYWICKGCGEMLINPRVPTQTDIAWICDGCRAMLNEQPDFSEDCEEWKCVECGTMNRIDESEIYLSEDEYTVALQNPYKGMSDIDIVELLSYEETGQIDGREDMILLQDEAGKQYVKKILDTYNESIYQYLMEHPIKHMPRIVGKYKGEDKLVVIEEFVDGVTLAEVLQNGLFSVEDAIRIVRDVCQILYELHSLKRPMIHRDIKPSNVMLDKNGEVVLLDVNVAKWCDPKEIEDTRLLGTLYFAAPEQFGYGFASSTAKADIYAVGILLNMLITGKIPKEEKATGDVWAVIETCIRLNSEERYSDNELIAELTKILGE